MSYGQDRPVINVRSHEKTKSPLTSDSNGNSSLLVPIKTVPDWSLLLSHRQSIPVQDISWIFIYPPGRSVYSHLFLSDVLNQYIESELLRKSICWTVTLKDDRISDLLSKRGQQVLGMCVAPAWWWSCSSSPLWWLSLTPFSLAPGALGHAPLLPAAPCAAVMPRNVNLHWSTSWEQKVKRAAILATISVRKTKFSKNNFSKDEKGTNSRRFLRKTCIFD